MVTLIRWYWAEEDFWAYDELDDERRSLRHVEVRDGIVVAAASLVEVLEARDSGDIEAVIAYESRFGIVPEGLFPPTDEIDAEAVTAEEFELLWQQGRRALE